MTTMKNDKTFRVLWLLLYEQWQTQPKEHSFICVCVYTAPLYDRLTACTEYLYYLFLCIFSVFFL